MVSLCLHLFSFKLSTCDFHIIYIKNFGLGGYVENEIYAFWLQKWSKDGPSYDNAQNVQHKKFMLPKDKLWDIFQLMVREM